MTTIDIKSSDSDRKIIRLNVIILRENHYQLYLMIKICKLPRPPVHLLIYRVATKRNILIFGVNAKKSCFGAAVLLLTPQWQQTPSNKFIKRL
jgi:hypothetical protein